MKLRPYQNDAVKGIFQAWETADSTLAVLPTGTGKTIVFAHVIKQRPPGKALLLAHREELIWQGASKIEAVTGIKPEIEMAEFEASTGWFKGEIVVSSIQTQNSGKNGAGRMTRFDPFDFSLLIIDEAHHATAPSYRRVIDYYRQNPNLKVLGVTATPDRSDEEALGQIFDTPAYVYEILDAIHDGWLVPIKQRAVYVEGLDCSTIRTTAGDLNGADLAAVMEYEENLHAIASPTLELTAGRKTLVFAASVAHAERLCEIFNRHKAACARFVCGETPKEERRLTLKEYAEARFQFLVNVGVATEGFDDPGIQCVVMARPTKSRSLYAQMAGRGTRPLPGLVDHPTLSEGKTAEESADARRWVIRESEKPFVEIIDFVGNSGRHKLITTADILGGNYSDATVEKAREMAERAGAAVDMSEALEEAQAEIEAAKAREQAQRASVRVRANWKDQVVSPFDTLQIEPRQERGWNKGRLPSEKQLSCLEKFGVNIDQVKSFSQASQLIETLIQRRQVNSCTFKQAKILSRYGYETKNVSFDQARSILDQLATNGWRPLNSPTVPQAQASAAQRPERLNRVY